MGALCDFCGEQRSMVYCKSDSASLCLSCDRNVHSANALSHRHARSLLCDACCSQPAKVRCIEEKMSFCHNCDLTRHSAPSGASGHNRHSVSCYTGCPSSAELSRMWSLFIELPMSGDSISDKGDTLINVNESRLSNSWNASEDNNSMEQALSGRASDIEEANKIEFWMSSSELSTMNSTSCPTEQQAGPMNSAIPKICCDGTKDIGLREGNELFEDFDMADIDLTFENYEELFGDSPNGPDHPFGDGTAGNLLMANDISALDPHALNDIFNEASSSAAGFPVVKELSGVSCPTNRLQISCKSVASTDSGMSNPGFDSDKSLVYPSRQACSSLSLPFSGLSGDSNAGDYQDCGISPMVIIGEPPPWLASCSEASTPKGCRDSAVKRYREKKKIRKYGRNIIRYQTRKDRAEKRKRVKGRFVKAGDDYDYDPSSQRSY